MIALIIMGVVTAGILKLYIVQHSNYLAQDDVVDIQQNVRASIDELGKHIKMAGHDLPLGMRALEAYDTNPDTIVIVYHDGGCDTYLSAAMPNPSSDLECATGVACFEDGQWVYIYEPDSALGEWFQISNVETASDLLQHSTMDLSRAYGADALVFALQHVKFFVDTTTDPDHPGLMIQHFNGIPQVYAENISDLQLQYKMKNGMVLDVPTLTENVREVLINVAGRSNIPEIDGEGESRFRSRQFSTSVFLRNVGI